MVCFPLITVGSGSGPVRAVPDRFGPVRPGFREGEGGAAAGPGRGGPVLESGGQRRPQSAQVGKHEHSRGVLAGGAGREPSRAQYV